MINGCLVLVGALMLINAAAFAFAGFPPFHVLVATVTISLALVLSRSTDTRWQVGALAAIGGPAAASAAYGYLSQPDADLLKGTSGLLYVSGAAIYALACIVHGARRSETPQSTEEDPS